MNITSSLRDRSYQMSAPLSNTAPEEAEGATPDSFIPSENSFGSRVLGGFVGAIVGGIAGAVSSDSAAIASGLGAGIATAATLGPELSQAVKAGLNGEPLNDLALTTGAVFAGGITLTSFSAAASLGAFALDQALPGSGRLVSAALGAAAGASIGLN